jgi:hypothetical protein
VGWVHEQERLGHARIPTGVYENFRARLKSSHAGSGTIRGHLNTPSHATDERASFIGGRRAPGGGPYSKGETGKPRFLGVLWDPRHHGCRATASFTLPNMETPTAF